MNAWAKYKGLTYLLLLLVVLPWAAWSLALKDTASKWRAYGKERRELAVLRETAASESGHVAAGAVLQTGEIIASGQFLRLISETADANRVAVERYTPYLTENGDGIEIMTGEITVSGDYISLVRVIDHIEWKIGACKLVSADFRSAKDRRSGRIKLTATLLVQQMTEIK